jgi:hypothetical protein
LVKQGSEKAVALCLYLLLCAAYIFSFDGVMASTDGQAMLAVTENIVKHGTLDVRQLADWEDAAIGNDGRPYCKYGVGLSLLMVPFYWLALRVPHLGLAQTVMVLEPLCGALTGALLYLFARRLGYGERVSVVAALVYALGTSAWVYAMLPRPEAVIALSLFVAAYALRFEGSRPMGALIAGLALTLAISTKVVYILAVPVMLVYALLCPGRATTEQAPNRASRSHPETGQASHGEESCGADFQTCVPGRGRLKPALRAYQDWRQRWPLLLSVAVVALGLGLIGFYNYGRFGNPLFSGYTSTEGFTTPLATGILGMLFGPYKSLFLFSPVYLLLPFTWVAFLRKHRSEALLGLALLVVHLFAFGAWWSWYAGKSWGPRFLAPLNPFLALALLPAVESVVERASLLKRAGALCIGLLSVGVQFLGLTEGRQPYLVQPDFSSPWGGLTVQDWPNWPIIGHLLRFGPGSLDFAWTRSQGEGTFWNWPLLAAILALGLLAETALLYTLIKRQTSRRFVLALLAGAVLLPLAVSWLALYSIYDDPAYVKGGRYDQAMRDNYASVLSYLERTAGEEDALVLTNSYYFLFFLNRNKLRLRWYALVKENEPEVASTAYRLIRQENQRVWVITDEVTNSKMPALVTGWLNAHGERLDERPFGDSVQLSLFRLQSESVSGRISE